jgi:predicted nucleic acid-binding protein
MSNLLLLAVALCAPAVQASDWIGAYGVIDKVVFEPVAVAPAYQAMLAGRPWAVSLIRLAEIEYGMELKNWGASRRDLMRRFLTRFTTLLPDTETAREWARTKSGSAWIAAAALQLNVALVTHNASDYRAVENLTILTAAAPTP